MALLPDFFIKWEKKEKGIVKVNLIFVDIAGDLHAGILLSQIVYWYLPGKDTLSNDTKLRVKKKDGYWLAKRRKDWWDECRLTENQYIRAIKILIKKGLVITKTYKFNGNPTTHIGLTKKIYECDGRIHSEQ